MPCPHLMFSTLLSLTVVSPTSATPPNADADPEPQAEVATSYGQAEAVRDVESILDARGRTYLDARSRLEANPTEAAVALVARLQGVPAPGPQHKQRTLAVLSSLRQPQHVQIFAEQLHNAMLDGKPTKVWKNLLLEQGSAAADVLFPIIGDRKLPEEQRGELLDTLVTIMPRVRLGEITALVGAGSRVLQLHLRRAMTRRCRRDTTDAATIRNLLNRGMDASKNDPPRLAALIVMRSSCGDEDEVSLRSLADLAVQDSTPFVVRVAAIDALAGHDSGLAALNAVIRQHGSPARRQDQRSELLTWLALTAMGASHPAEAGTLVETLGLAEATSPRLAAIGYSFVPLSTDQLWLDASLGHPWPQVRHTAISRVEGPCARATVKTLHETASAPLGPRATSPVVAKAAVLALGRCANERAFDALADVLGQDEIATPIRGAAAAQLVEHDVPGGADLIARVLARQGLPGLARELTEALARAPAPSRNVWEALCLALHGQDAAIVPAARVAIRRLYPESGCEAVPPTADATTGPR